MLLIALFVLVIMATVGATLAAALRFRMERLERETTSVQLTALMDAALAHSMAEIALDTNWKGTGGPRSLGKGQYAVSAWFEGTRHIRVYMVVRWRGSGRAAEALIDFYDGKVEWWKPRPFDPADPMDLPGP